jgi:cytochrome c-type biogenesis protein CcmH/NrfG
MHIATHSAHHEPHPPADEVALAVPLLPLSEAIDRYAAKLTALHQVDSRPTVEQVLDVLVARDAVRSSLANRGQDMGDLLLKLNVLDHFLRQQAETIYTTVDLREWHRIMAPREGDWWWFLEQPPKTHWAVRFDWLWNSVAVLWLISAIALIVDIARRFLSIGPDTLETFVVLGEGSIAILAAGGALTIAGRKVTDRMLLSVGVPVRFLQEAKAIVAIALLLSLIYFRVSLPDIARFYNNRAVQRYHAGELTYALRDLHRALSLDPNYVQAHYNLGLIYEDIGDFEEAQVQYRFATQGDLDLAFINLARLYILGESYSQAAALLEERLLAAEEADVRYDMLKNLGWARLGQGRYDEAVTRLRQAIELKPEQAPAHCLIAQAYEGLAQPDQAMSAWEQCLAFASVFRPDEDAWIGMAKQRFESH